MHGKPTLQVTLLLKGLSSHIPYATYLHCSEENQDFLARAFIVTSTTPFSPIVRYLPEPFSNALLKQ